MIWLGLNRNSHGYYQAVKAFERDGTRMSPKMRRALVHELARARAELDRIERAVEGSGKKKTAGRK